VLRRLLTTLRHPITRNVIALYWVQVAMFVLPLITLPYLARVLEPSAYGLVIFAQGVAALLTVFVDWGLGWTGVRGVAEDRTDPDRLAGVVQRVRGGQLLLAAASVVIALAAFALHPTLRDHPGFLVLAWVTAVASALSPDWFFLGIEKARVTAFILLGFRVIAAALTFVLVRNADDAWIVMALLAGTSVGGLIVADSLMYRRVAFRVPDWRSSLAEIRQATTIFVGGLAVGLYTAFNVVLLGFFESSADVAHFGAAERLVRTSMLILTPIGGAVIPRLTALQAEGRRDRARKLLITATLAALVPALVLLIALAGFGHEIVHVLYGDRFVDETVPILRVLALIVPVNVTGSILVLWLLTLHKEKLILRIVLIAGVANIIFGCLFTSAWGSMGMAWSVIAAEALTAVGALFLVLRDSRQVKAAGGASPPVFEDPEQAGAATTSSGV
jgi:PST family polysaccharide transporter